MNNVWESTMMGQGLIIGVLDTGIKAKHPSFSDNNIPPPPTKWKGNCSYKGFHCNKKIIGAKAFFIGTNPSPNDTNGHGTHVESTTTGNFVKNANVLGMAKGEASDTTPMAHLSIYKVCFQNGCASNDIYAAIDQAIKDGVDILSMSISGGHNATFYEDIIAKGSLAAIQYGIVPVTVAGNDGPKTSTLSHSANATATIRFNGTQFGFRPARAVASFSSRGPSRMNGGIIKPDVLAPGVNILAAWPFDVGPNSNLLATHTFNFDSGTSMAATHVSGIVALVKSKHHGWTPAEIISAIVTTANDSWTASDLIADDNTYNTAGIHATGAGQVQAC